MSPINNSNNKNKKDELKIPICGLCGKKKKLIKTDCCNNWICNDENKYVIFSYARNSCARNHRRFTLCASHKTEDHSGNWQTCKKCFDSFNSEMYVWYGTNEYNFTKLRNPPSYEPTHCEKCNNIISLSNESYSLLCGVYRCDNCPITEKERNEVINRYKDQEKRKLLN